MFLFAVPNRCCDLRLRRYPRLCVLIIFEDKASRHATVYGAVFAEASGQPQIVDACEDQALFFFAYGLANQRNFSNKATCLV